MDTITYPITLDINSITKPNKIYIANMVDVGTRFLSIALYSNGTRFTIPTTALISATFVTDDVLISDDVECTLSSNKILVPIQNLQQHGNLSVQIKITDDKQVIATPRPIEIIVTPDIGEIAQVKEKSIGSYAEVVQEIADARGTYTDLGTRVDALSSEVTTLIGGSVNLSVNEMIDGFAETLAIRGNKIFYTDSNSETKAIIGTLPSGGGGTGVDGKSAYEIAVEHGYEGTEEEWLQSLNGKDGKSAYEIAVEQGYEGTEEEWLSEIKDYSKLNNKPSINGVKLSGDKTSAELGLQSLINNYFTVENNEYLSYDFNSVGAGVNSVLYCVPFERISNFPNNLVGKIRQSGTLYIFHYVHTLAGARYLIRRIMGRDLNGQYKEFAQYCSVADGSSFPVAQSDWVELTGSGSRIVSGVVNAQGHIEFTDSDGNTFTTTGESVIGPQGVPGRDYVLTAQDKTDIADIVLSELPTTEGVLYGNTSN